MFGKINKGFEQNLAIICKYFVAIFENTSKYDLSDSKEINHHSSL